MENTNNCTRSIKLDATNNHFRCGRPHSQSKYPKIYWSKDFYFTFWKGCIEVPHRVGTGMGICAGMQDTG